MTDTAIKPEVEAAIESVLDAELYELPATYSEVCRYMRAAIAAYLAASGDGGGMRRGWTRCRRYSSKAKMFTLLCARTALKTVSTNASTKLTRTLRLSTGCGDASLCAPIH